MMRDEKGKFINENKLIKKQCLNCQKEFFTYFLNQKFCSTTCRGLGFENNIKLDENLAYLLGVLCGDGFISNHKGKLHHMGLNVTDKDFAIAFRDACSKVFGKTPSISFAHPKKPNHGGVYSIKVYGKGRLRKINEFERFTTYCWRVPNVIRDAEEKIKYAFIKGYADSEASVNKVFVNFSSVNKIGLQDIQQLLTSLGIYSKFYEYHKATTKNGKTFVLNIQSKRSIKLFREKIGFAIQRRQEKLDKLIENYSKRYHPVENYDSVIALRQNLGYGCRRISKLTGINVWTVSDWLRNRSTPYDVRDRNKVGC